MKWIGLTVAAICLSTLVAIAIDRHLPALMRLILGHTLPQELAGLPDRSFWIVRSWVTALAAIFLQVPPSYLSLLLLRPAVLPGAPARRGERRWAVEHSRPFVCG